MSGWFFGNSYTGGMSSSNCFGGDRRNCPTARPVNKNITMKAYTSNGFRFLKVLTIRSCFDIRVTFTYCQLILIEVPEPFHNPAQFREPEEPPALLRLVCHRPRALAHNCTAPLTGLQV